MEERKDRERGTAQSAQSSWDSFVTTEIKRFLARYQALAITVKGGIAHVHVPYMMGTVTWIEQPEILSRQRPRHQVRLKRAAKARLEAPPDLRAFFQHWFYEQDGKERLVAGGRSGPEEIRQLLQAAVDADMIPTQGDDLTGEVLRAWLQRYGIGVDCSSCVQHTLTHLIRASYAAVGERPTSPQETRVGWMRSPTVRRKLLENAEDRRFDLIATPTQARPGDFMVSTGHCRIIVSTRVTEEKALLVTLAESTSRTDLVGGTHYEHDVGPRLYQVRYPAPGRPVADQHPEHKRISEAPFEFEPSAWERQFLIARNRKLAAIQLLQAP